MTSIRIVNTINRVFVIVDQTTELYIKILQFTSVVSTADWMQGGGDSDRQTDSDKNGKHKNSFQNWKNEIHCQVKILDRLKTLYFALQAIFCF